ncbi:MAG: N-acetyl-D-glucosamine kinase [Saprospiraceae bacterium]|nr:N-acetyl-D-glucosamine kinase [Saprospiraceae bacterium]
MTQKNISIGVDIGGTHITCAAVHIREGRVLEGTLSRASYRHDAALGVILHNWAKALNETIAKVDATQLAGIGFAIPGPFEYRNGISRMQHKFPKLYGVHIPSALDPLLAMKDDLPMRFLNDATAFAVGEAWLGEGKGFQKVVVITLGTGFGSAFIDGGVPVVAREDVPKEGCLWHLPFKDSIADDYFSTKWFLQEYEKRTGEQAEGVKVLMDKAGADGSVKSLFEQFGHNLAECLAPWLKTFGAEILVIGGNIAHALPLFEAAFRDDLQRAGVLTKISASRLYETAALIGSARLLDDAFWGKVAVELPNI